MDDIPMADASDNDSSSGSRRMFTIQNVLSENEQRSRTNSTDSTSSVSGYISCNCSSDIEPEVLSAKFFSNNMYSKYYPTIDKPEEILPTHWSIVDRHNSLFVSSDKRLVRYLGKGEDHKDASSVRANSPIPRGCGVYYFEIKILSKGDNHKSLVGIGICTGDVPLDRLPGWDKESYGYHGDDGYFFPCCGKGTTYGPQFGSGDIVGCGINFAKKKLFFTKNGEHLGYLDITLNLQNDYYPVVGMQAINEVAIANFGQENFKFNLINEQKDAYIQIRDNFNTIKLPDEKIVWMNNAVSNWLNHVGYYKTYEIFCKSININNNDEIYKNIEKRYNYVKAIKEARLVLVIDDIEKEFNKLFEKNSELLLLLKIQKFIDRNYWSQKVINGEILPPINDNSTSGTARIITRSQRKNSPSIRSIRSGIKRRSGSQNSDESSPRRSLRNSISSDVSNDNNIDISNGHYKNGVTSTSITPTTTTIIAERNDSNDSVNGDTEMEDLSDQHSYYDLFDSSMHDVYKYYEPTIQDARQIMALMNKISPISQGLHDLAMRTLDMMSCTLDVLREEYSDLISQDHRDKVAEAFNRCLIEYEGETSSKTPILDIMSSIRQMAPDLSMYSVGGIAYADIDKMIFDTDTKSITSDESELDDEDESSSNYNESADDDNIDED